MSGNDLIKPEEIQSKIHTIRSVQVIPDEELALLYGVKNKVLNQAAKRNSERFPDEFMFQINNDELSHLKSQIGFLKKDSLRSQNVTLDSARGKHRKYLPYAFTEQYPAIVIKEFKNSHDRFIIIENTTVYHSGASLKDLGKKWFAFSKMDIGAVEMLTRLEGMK